MKLFSLIASLVALLAFALAPTAAFAYNQPGQGAVVVSPPQENGDGTCTSTVVVQGAPNVTSITIVVTDADGVVVDRQTKSATAGDASFSITVECGGSFTVTATDQNGILIGESEFTTPGDAPGDGGQGAGDGSGDGTTAGSGAGTGSDSGSGSSSDGTNSVGGGLPATGASSLLTVGAGLGLLLLLGGGAMLVRRRQTA